MSSNAALDIPPPPAAPDAVGSATRGAAHRSRSRRWRRRGVVLAMLIGVLGIYCPAIALWQGKIISGGDFPYLHVRRMAFAQEQLFHNPSGAHLPAWYPRELLGTPFWSNVQNFPFLPTRLLVLLTLDPQYTYTFAILIAALLTAAFTYLYAQRIGLGAVAAAAAGWTFACCGFFAGRIPAGHMPLLEAMPALPLLLWLIEVCLQSPPGDRRFAWKLVTLGLSCGTVMLAGHPQVPIYALFTAGLYVMYRAPGRVRLAATTLLAMAIGVGVAAFALYPMMLLVGRSTRILSLAKADNDIAFPYGRLKAFLFPWADGWAASARQNAKVPLRRFTAYPSVAYFWDTICYTGWLPILAAAALLLRWIIVSATGRARRWRETLATPWPFITLLGVLSIALALPFWQRVMSHIPGTILRSPARQVYLTDFALAMALGGAVCVVMRFVNIRRGTSASVVAACLVAAALAGHVIDEGRHARNFIYTVPYQPLSDPAADRALRDFAGDDRVAIDVMQRIARQLDDVGFFDSIMLARPYRVILDLAQLPPDHNMQMFNGAGLTRRGLAFLGVTFLLTATPRPDLTWQNPGTKPMQYTVPNPEPRVRFFPATMSRYFAADDIHKILRDERMDLASGLMLPTNYMPSTPPPPATPVDPARLGTPGVVYRRPAPDRIDIDVTADQDGFVRVIESFDPGWRATLDGEPVQILPGDDVFLAVHVPPGVHALQFVYHTPGASAGLAISGVSVACLTLLAVFANRHRRHAPAP